MESLVRLETFLNSTVFLFISYWIIQNGISICRLKIVLNSVKKTAAIATKSKLISLLDEVSISLLKLSQSIGSAITYILLDFWFKWAMRLQMRPYDWKVFPFDLECFWNFCLNGKHPRSQWLKWLFLHVIFCRMLDAFSRCLGMYCSLETWLFLYSLKNEQEWHIIGFKNSWLRLEFFTW